MKLTELKVEDVIFRVLQLANMRGVITCLLVPPDTECDIDPSLVGVTKMYHQFTDEKGCMELVSVPTRKPNYIALISKEYDVYPTNKIMSESCNIVDKNEYIKKFLNSIADMAEFTCNGPRYLKSGLKQCPDDEVGDEKTTSKLYKLCWGPKKKLLAVFDESEMYLAEKLREQNNIHVSIEAANIGLSDLVYIEIVATRQCGYIGGRDPEYKYTASYRVAGTGKGVIDDKIRDIEIFINKTVARFRAITTIPFTDDETIIASAVDKMYQHLDERAAITDAIRELTNNTDQVFVDFH